MLIFFLTEFSRQSFLRFRTHVVVTTVCTTVSVHTLTCCTHIFLLQSLSAHIRTSLCVSHTRMAQVHEKGVCRMSVFVLYLAFSLFMSHPSFAVSVRRLSLSLSLDFPVHTFLPYLPVLKAQGVRISARGREVWLSGQVRPQHGINGAYQDATKKFFKGYSPVKEGSKSTSKPIIKPKNRIHNVDSGALFS